MMDHLFIGQIVHTKSLDEFEIFIDGFIAVQNGKVSLFQLALNFFKFIS